MTTVVCVAGIAWAMSLLVFLYLVHTAPLLDENMQPVEREPQQQQHTERTAA